MGVEEERAMVGRIPASAARSIGPLVVAARRLRERNNLPWAALQRSGSSSRPRAKLLPKASAALMEEPEPQVGSSKTVDWSTNMLMKCFNMGSGLVEEWSSRSGGAE